MSTPEAPALSDRLQTIVTLLRHDRVQEADDVASEMLAAQRAADAAAAGKITPPPAPRPMQVIWLDFAHRVSSKFGHPAVLEELLEELDKALAVEGA